MKDAPAVKQPDVLVDGRPLLWHDTKKPVPYSALADGVTLVGFSEEGCLCKPTDSAKDE